MANPQIHDLAIANGQNYLGLTNAGGVQEYRQLDPGDFTVSGDINNNGMSFADVIAGNAPAVTPTPPAAPLTPANTATLIREYDDIVRVWRRTAGVWAHAFDLNRRKSFSQAFNIIDKGVSAAFCPGVTPGNDFYIVPEHLNGAFIYEWKCAALAGAGASTVSYALNGVNPACATAIPVGVAITTTSCILVQVFEDDIIDFITCRAPGSTQAGISVTMEFLLPN